MPPRVSSLRILSTTHGQAPGPHHVGILILKPFKRKRLCYGRFQSATRPLEWARGATLAVDVVAASDIPPYDLAMRDGWAVSSLDDHRDIDEVSLLNGTLPEPLKRGHARWINTGGMIPIGCDAVIAAASPDDRAAARQAVASERHVLRRGADRRRGEVILRKGTRLGVRETALLSEACIEEVQVSRTPRILILATGSEITMGRRIPSPAAARAMRCICRRFSTPQGSNRAASSASPTTRTRSPARSKDVSGSTSS